MSIQDASIIEAAISSMKNAKAEIARLREENAKLKATINAVKHLEFEFDDPGSWSRSYAHFAEPLCSILYPDQHPACETQGSDTTESEA